MAGVNQHEVEVWKGLYPRIDVRKALNKTKELVALEFRHGQRGEMVDTKTGEWVPWDGTKSFWGLKRLIMMLFDEEREMNAAFQDLPDPVKDDIRRLDMREFLKKSAPL